MRLLLDTEGHKVTEKKSTYRWSQRLVLCYHKPRNARLYQNLKEVRKDSPLETSEHVWLCQYLDF